MLKSYGNANKMCMKGNNQLYMVIDTDPKQCQNLDWPVLNGFITKDKFYLFGSTYVVIFPEVVFTKPDQPVQIERVNYGSFIQCEGKIDPRAWVVTKGLCAFYVTFHECDFMAH